VAQMRRNKRKRGCSAVKKQLLVSINTAREMVEKTSQNDLSLRPSFWSMQIADVPAAAVWSCKQDEAPPRHQLNGLATLRACTSEKRISTAGTGLTKRENRFCAALQSVHWASLRVWSLFE
jgi:hypothetical protein